MKRFIFFLFFSSTVTAQLREVAEVSFVLPEGISEDITVIPVNDDIVLVNYQDDYSRREQRIVILRYNSNLELIWTGTALLPKFFVPASFTVEGNTLYYLTRELEGKKLHLVEFNLGNDTVRGWDFESITLLENIGFTMFGGKPLIAGIYNLKPVVEMHNLQDKTARVLPNIYNKNNELRGIFVNPYRDELYVFTSFRNNCQMEVTTYDENGKMLVRRNLGDKKHRIRQIQVKPGAAGEPFILGTYNSACLDMTEGLFSGSLDLPQEIKYHSISGLPAYKASLSDKRRKRLQLRKEKGRGGEIRQKAIFHVPVMGVNGFLVAADFYVGVPVVVVGDVSRYERTKYKPVSEYRIWRILLAELDPEGQVTYDRLYKLEGEVFRGFRPQSAFLFKEDEFYAFLPFDNKLLYAGAGKTESYPLFGPEEGFRTSNTETSLFNLNINSFIAHGATEIRPAATEGVSRQIYFIKKFQF